MTSHKAAVVNWHSKVVAAHKAAAAVEWVVAVGPLVDMLVVHNSHLKRLLAEVVYEDLLVRHTLGLQLVGVSWTPGMSRVGRVAGGVFYHPAYLAELMLLLEKSLADILPVAEAYLTEYRAPWRLSPGKHWHCARWWRSALRSRSAAWKAR